MASFRHMIAVLALLLISGTVGEQRRLQALPPATCRGQVFSALVEEECGGPPLNAGGLPENEDDDGGDGDDDGQEEFAPSRSNWTPLSALSREDCERGVTARELQRNIVAVSDVQCVAQILVQTASAGGIEDGMRIDPNFNFRPACGERESDPDVVAMKGIALAILAGRVGDDGLAVKVVNGLVPSLTAPGTDHKEKDQSGLPSCATHPPPCAPCHTPPGQSPLQVANKKPHGIDRSALLRSLSDRALMLKVFNEDPNVNRPCPSQPVQQQPVVNADDDDGDEEADGDDDAGVEAGEDNDNDRRRRLLAREGGTFDTGRITRDAPFGRRRLECADCDNADSFPCAYCWQEDVCGDMYWCKDPEDNKIR